MSRSAKDLRVAPISSQDGDRLIRAVHYSGTVVRNSQVHLGVFLDGRLEGAMQFGPSLDKSNIVHLVNGTPWNGFIELNRMAFSERLPRNSESRALGVAMRMLRQAYPHLQWVVSFADGTQCGDGTIYRAAGFVLTGIRENKTIIRLPNGQMSTNMLMTANWNGPQIAKACAELGIPHIYRTIKQWRDLGAEILPGHQMRYMYFLHPDARARLAVSELPFSAIDEIGGRIYRGVKRGKQANPEFPSGRGGAAPTPTLQP